MTQNLESLDGKEGMDKIERAAETSAGHLGSIATNLGTAATNLGYNNNNKIEGNNGDLNFKEAEKQNMDEKEEEVIEKEEMEEVAKNETQGQQKTKDSVDLQKNKIEAGLGLISTTTKVAGTDNQVPLELLETEVRLVNIINEKLFCPPCSLHSSMFTGGGGTNQGDEENV